MSNLKYVLTFYFSRIFFRNKQEEEIAGETKVKERRKEWSRKEKKKERKKEKKKKRNMKLHDWMLYSLFSTAIAILLFNETNFVLNGFIM